MDLFLTIPAIFIILIYSVVKGVYVLYPLLLGLVVFTLLSLRRGHSIRDIAVMICQGTAKSMQLNLILFLIGAAIALWMASGTVPFLIYYSIKFIYPQLFILSIFLITFLTSLLLGTSFGAIGTIGIVFMIIARAGHINVDLAAGAIISAAYLGERSSPVSSSANLIAILTNTKVHDNVKRMLGSSVWPFLTTILIYTLLSLRNPLYIDFHSTGNEILRNFNISPLVLLPALAMVILIMLKVDIRITLTASMAVALVEGLLLQSGSLVDLVNCMLWGFKADGSLSGIMHGGGAVSMAGTVLVVMVSSAYAGIFEGTDMLTDFAGLIEGIGRKAGLFSATTMTSILSACFGCSQTFAIIITNQFMRKLYAANNRDRSGLAVDIGDTAQIISPLVPWNIAGTLPAGLLSVGAGFIPYSFCLYLVPLFILGQKTALRYPGRYFRRVPGNSPPMGGSDRPRG